MDLTSITRAAENRTWCGHCFKVICGAPTTLQGYGVGCLLKSVSYFTKQLKCKCVDGIHNTSEIRNNAYPTGAEVHFCSEIKNIQLTEE